MSAPSNALSRLRTLCTNSKNPRYSGSFSWDMPRCGRSQLRNSDQKPVRDRSMRGRQYTPSSNATTLESNKSVPWNQWQLCYGISGNFRVEQVAALAWNRWQASPGIGGSFGVEYALDAETASDRPPLRVRGNRYTARA